MKSIIFRLPNNNMKNLKKFILPFGAQATHTSTPWPECYSIFFYY